MYVRSIEAQYENYSTMHITENRKAADPACGELIRFLDRVTIPREKYETGRTAYEVSAGYPPTYRIADVVPGQPYVRHYPGPYESFNETRPMGTVAHVEFLS